MQIQELKRGFWGYSKESVYHYIADLNEAFSARLMEKDQKVETATKELREQNQQLGAQVKELQTENRQLREKQLFVSDSIIDAKDYAAQLKAQALHKEQAFCHQLEERMKEENSRLDGYAQSISRVREQISQLLQNFDLELELMQEAAQNLEQPQLGPGLSGLGEEEPSPSDQNMSLFQRKKP